MLTVIEEKEVQELIDYLGYLQDNEDTLESIMIQEIINQDLLGGI